MRSFKRAFKTALKQVLVVYPEARVELISGGLRLYRSPPPVAQTKTVALGSFPCLGRLITPSMHAPQYWSEL